MYSITNRIEGKYLQIKSQILSPRFAHSQNRHTVQMQRLGSEYGRKFFSPAHLRERPLLVSGGVGEDISFDVEFIRLYTGRAVLFDPTPRAIQHMEKVFARLGDGAQTNYSQNGEQSVDSYDLQGITRSDLEFHNFALLDSRSRVKFYEPPVSEHVSYSIQNIQNQFKSAGSYIEVDTISAIDVKEILCGSEIDIMKLDIEGSEYAFLESCFLNQIYPIQILVEIDELHFPSFRSRKVAKKLQKLLLKYQYSLIYRDGFNFTFIRRDDN